MTSKHDIVEWFETEHHIRFKRKGQGDEYASLNGCPWCGASSGVSDRFHVWRDKQNYWCRKCGVTGYLDELTGEQEEWTRLDDHERRIRRLEAQQRELERRQEEHERRLTALEKLARQAHLTWEYHTNIYQEEERLQYWLDEGFTFDTIQEYELGWCPQCPSDWTKIGGEYQFVGRPSYTIPVRSNGRLWNIRHRLIGEEGHGKYRPHMKDLPDVLFGADQLRQPGRSIWILEGEKKSIMGTQLGIPNVGLMGKQAFNVHWVERFADFQEIYVCLDPDAWQQAVEIAAHFERRGRVVGLPGKFDDLAREGWAQEDMLAHARYAWRV
jgi:DNA primase